MPSGIQNWSQTASNNGTADSAINWPEGMAPSAVNDSARAMMAVVAKWRDDTAGTLTTGGTSTAYTLTTNTVFTTLALLSGQRLKVKFNATSGASPTLNVDGLGAKALQLYSGTAIPTGMIVANSIWDVTYDNSIPAFIVQGVPEKLPSNIVAPASIAVSATQRLLGRYSSGAGAGEEISLGSGLLLNSSGVLSAATAAGVQIVNGTIAESNATNEATFELKTLAGTDPSSSDPVYVIFRNATAATGNFVVRTVTSALSIVIPSTGTMGASNGVAFRLWLVLFDDGGTVRLGVINCLSGTNIYPLGQFSIASSTQIETGSDNAHTFYTNSAAVTSKPYVVFGYGSYESGLASAGNWNVSPTRLHLQGPSDKLPGDVIQIQRNYTGAHSSGADAIPGDDTVPQSDEGIEFMTQAITPTSAANLLDIDWQARVSGSAAVACVAALFRDSGTDALAAPSSATVGTTSATMLNGAWTALAGSTSATTLKVRIGDGSGNTIYFNGTTGGRQFGGASNSFLRVKEIMA